MELAGGANAQAAKVSDVKRLALEHVPRVEAKMAELHSMRDATLHLAEPATVTTGPSARSSTSSPGKRVPVKPTISGVSHECHSILPRH